MYVCMYCLRFLPYYVEKPKYHDDFTPPQKSAHGKADTEGYIFLDW